MQTSIDSSDGRIDMPKRTGLFGEMWLFLKESKKWWLLPILVVLVAVSALLVFAQTSALAPFIYTIF